MRSYHLVAIIVWMLCRIWTFRTGATKRQALSYRVALFTFETTSTLYFLFLLYYILLTILLDISGICYKYQHPSAALDVLRQYTTASAIQINRCKTCSLNCTCYAWYTFYLLQSLCGFKEENLSWSCTYYYFCFFKTI